MKKIFLFTLAVVGLTFQSCDINDENEGKFHANPSSGTIETQLEMISATGVTTISVPVLLNTSTNPSNLDVTYSIETVDGNPPSSILGTFTQKDAVIKGDLEGTLELNGQAPTTEDCYSVKITLMSTSRSEVSVSTEELISTETIIKFGNVTPSYSGITSFQGSPTENFTANLTPIEGMPDTFELDTAWGQGLVGTLTGDSSLEAPYDGLLIINTDGSVTIEGNATYATGGTGSFNPCDGTITYTLTQAFFANQDLTFDVVLTQN